jgi:hypothetical protein
MKNREKKLDTEKEKRTPYVNMTIQKLEKRKKQKGLETKRWKLNRFMKKKELVRVLRSISGCMN